MTTENQKKNEVAKTNNDLYSFLTGEDEKSIISYEVAGAEIKLSLAIVKHHLVKGDASKITRTDLVGFMSICRYNQLNPFLNEAYLVKFGDAPAQMIVSKEAFMKRAEANSQYDGLRAGIIIKRGAEVIELEGAFMLDDDILLGGWADVYRKDRKYPIRATITLKEYDTKKSIWSGKPRTMIRKVAIVQALREAFPAQLGAMYVEEEQNSVVNAEYEELPTSNSDNQNRRTIKLEDLPNSETEAQINTALEEETKEESTKRDIKF